MKIVRFDSGQFAVRKGWIIYKYLDLCSSYDNEKWLDMSYYNFSYRCKGTLSEVTHVIDRIKTKPKKEEIDYGTPYDVTKVNNHGNS